MFFDELNDAEWARLSTLIVDEPVRLNRRGRPRAENRIVANAVLWILTTGEPWSKLPSRYPSGPTCRRRFEDWLASGLLAEMVKVLSDESGRRFAYVPPPPAPGAAVRRAPPEAAADCDRLRGVFWQNPQSWRLPLAQTGMAATEVAVSVRRFVSDDDRDNDSRNDRSVAAARATVMHDGRPGHRRTHQTSFHDATRVSQQTETYRGYTVYGGARPVRNLMYRAWAEIVQVDRRVERSGLIGPRFTDAESAQHYALDWARGWIDRHCPSGNATPVEKAKTEVACAADQTVATIAELSGIASAESKITHLAAEWCRPADNRDDAPKIQLDRHEYAEYRIG
ncbi:transposase [Burkholderia singularis]|uniref:Transposase and inactivated derivatives n=1 Tax=Burkholderia singularis TaxID=1503053 RepID=A0A238H2I2_9BURK|nr:transposase [Burkholderia singularis]SMF99405.1 Transposase and inactivated derivatives [Burkholderia singularis]